MIKFPKEDTGHLFPSLGNWTLRIGHWTFSLALGAKEMVVGTMLIEFHIHENQSLKGKRKIVKSIVDRIKHKFNVSVAEVGSNDKWQRIELGISTVGNDRRHIDSSLNNVLDFIESLYLADIVDVKTEVFNL